jgi:GNAT superfamily N-acetyltransferase
VSNRLAEVRQATWEDCPAIAATLQRALAELDTPYPAPELPYACQYIMDLAAQGLAFVAVAGNDIVGTLILESHAWSWNRSERFLTNIHFWIERPYRSGGIAQRLLTEAKRVADQSGLPLVLELSSGGNDHDLLDRFVRIQGFRPMGGKFIRQPTGGGHGQQ